jgi:hypothetical protein
MCIHRGRVLAAPLALAAAAYLGACDASGGTTGPTGPAGTSPTGAAGPASPASATTPGAGPPAPPAAVPQPRTVKWIDLAAGDCLAEPPPTDPGVVLVTVVDCAMSHAAEVFLRVPVEVNAATANVANAKCSTGLSEYTRGPATAGPFSVAYLIDSNQDRTTANPLPSTVICLLQAADGASLAGSARR